MGRASTSRAPSTDRFKKPLLGVAAPSRPARAVNRILIDGDGAFEAVLFFFWCFMANLYWFFFLLFPSVLVFVSVRHSDSTITKRIKAAVSGARPKFLIEIAKKTKTKQNQRKNSVFFSSNTHRGVAPWRVADAARRLC